MLARDVGEPSAKVRDRVLAARARALVRGGPARNSAASVNDLDQWGALGAAEGSLLRQAAERFGLSARGVLRVRRVARTIADLAASPRVGPIHLAEALQFRMAGIRDGTGPQ